MFAQSIAAIFLDFIAVEMESARLVAQSPLTMSQGQDSHNLESCSQKTKPGQPMPMRARDFDKKRCPA
jgi:hypothetical protein